MTLVSLCLHWGWWLLSTHPTCEDTLAQTGKANTGLGPQQKDIGLVITSILHAGRGLDLVQKLL